MINHELESTTTIEIFKIWAPTHTRDRERVEIGHQAKLIKVLRGTVVLVTRPCTRHNDGADTASQPQVVTRSRGPLLGRRMRTRNFPSRPNCGDVVNRRQKKKKKRR